MSKEDEEKYSNILSFYVNNMTRVNDKDKDFSEDEMTEQYNKLFDEMNVKMKALLTPENYVIHLEAFSKILYSVNTKRGVKE